MSVSQEEFRSPGRTVNQEAGEHGTKLVLLGSTLGKGTDLSYALRAGRREWSHLECWDFVYFCGLRQKPYNPLPSPFLTWIAAEKGHLLVEHSHFPYIWSSHLSSSLSSSATLQDMFLSDHLTQNRVWFLVGSPSLNPHFFFSPWSKFLRLQKPLGTKLYDC